MRFIIALLFCTIFCNEVTAQRTALSYRKARRYRVQKPIDTLAIGDASVYIYKEKSNDFRFIGRLGLVGLKVAPEFGFNVNAGAEIFAKKKFSVFGNYTLTLWDQDRNNAINSTQYSKNELQLPKHIELGARYFISDQQIQKKRRIYTSRKTFGRMDIVYYINPELKFRKIIAARGGVWTYNATANPEMNKDFNKRWSGSGVVVTKDGLELGSGYYTNRRTFGGFVGVSQTLLINTISSNSLRGANVYQSRGIRDIYGDILFGSTRFDAFKDSLGTHDIEPNKDGSFQTFPIGFRAGITTSSINNGRWITNLEAGIRPGLKKKGFYAALTVAMAIY